MFRRWPTASGSLSDAAVGISPLGHRFCIVLRQSGRMFRRWPTASGWTSNVATGLSPLGHRICIVSRMRPVFPTRASLGCGDTLNLHNGTSTADSRQSSLCLRLTQMIYQADNHEWLLTWGGHGAFPGLRWRAGGRRTGATENKPMLAAGNPPKAAPARRTACQTPTPPAVSAFGTRLPAGADTFGGMNGKGS
jgi:hypothetical protein